MVRVGAQRLAADPGRIPEQRLGLVTNHSGVSLTSGTTIDLLHRTGRLAALFGPEHGVRGDAQAGEKVSGSHDPVTGVIVHSLYGDTKRPTAAMLQGLDALVFDIQDAGSRFYTYIYTLLYVLQAAAAQQLPVYILDRPNPLGGEQVEGNLLDSNLQSFVGYPIPIRHGLTVGELAVFFCRREQLTAPVHVIPMQGWTRSMLFPDTGLPWVPPSPNLPSYEAALLYPGTCLVEGTNVSEGRGTTLPFQMLGAPWLNGRQLAEHMNTLDLPGVWFRATSFTPTAGKYHGQWCSGIQIHVIRMHDVRPVRTGLLLLQTMAQLFSQFAFVEPPPSRKYFFDLLAGTTTVRQYIHDQRDVTPLLARWEEDARTFLQERQGYLHYS